VQIFRRHKKNILKNPKVVRLFGERLPTCNVLMMWHLSLADTVVQSFHLSVVTISWKQTAVMAAVTNRA
jgi:hypothetical protein